MLIETPIKENDTVTIRTTAGEEIVAKYIKENNETITISKPLALVATGDSMGLAPMTFTADPSAEVPLRKNAVQFMVRTETEMAKQYIQSSTGFTV